MTKNGNTLTYRVSILEDNYNCLDKKLDIILQNDLPHLHEEMVALKTRVTNLTIVNVGALLLVGLIAYLLQL